MAHVTRSDKTSILESATYAGGDGDARAEPLRVEFDETFFRA